MRTMLISQPVIVGRALRCGHQLNLRGTGLPRHIAIDDGSGLPRTSMKGLANQPGHAGERESVHGKDLVFRHHAGALRLGERLNQKAGAMGVIEGRPGAVGIEETVKVRSRAGGIKERRTNGQDGQQQVRKFGGVGLHGGDKAFLLLRWSGGIRQVRPFFPPRFAGIGRVESSVLGYTKIKNASGGMVADRSEASIDRES